ncbi:MAG: hypothetical protein E7326_04245 [Clostridiales bacterium]|nr:hypothetical protein [Clostridiales bacterium]
MDKFRTEEELRTAVTAAMDAIYWPDSEKQRLLGQVRGGMNMKKKMAAWSLCSAALVLLLCSCALAFSRPADETPADQSIARVEKMSFVIPEEGNYPACVLVVEKMLYDGQNLLIGYRTEGGTAFAEEAFEDADRAARKKGGAMFGDMHVRTIWDQFPALHKGQFSAKQKSFVLSRYEWALDNMFAAENTHGSAPLFEHSCVLKTEDDLTYLYFENLCAEMQDLDVLAVRLPLLQLHTRAVWYSNKENMYFGITGAYGNTREIALSVPKSKEKVTLPENDVCTDSPCHVLLNADGSYTVRAQNDYPAYTVWVEESVIEGSQLRIAVDMTGSAGITNEIPNEVTPDWQYLGMLPEVQADPEGFLPYSPELHESVKTLKKGSAVTSRQLMIDGEVADRLGDRITSDRNEWMWKVEKGEEGRTDWLYLPSGFTDELPAWYGSDTYELYIPVISVLDALYADGDGRVYQYIGSFPTPVYIPVSVEISRTGDVLWEEPVYSPFGNVEMTEEGKFIVGGSTALEIVQAAYDGENIVIGYKMESNDRYRVSQELETLHWDRMDPWTDLHVTYDEEITYLNYRLRDVMDVNDQVFANTADAQPWKNREHVSISLVIGEMKNGKLTTQATPRIRILLQNTKDSQN